MLRRNNNRGIEVDRDAWAEHRKRLELQGKCNTERYPYPCSGIWPDWFDDRDWPAGAYRGWLVWLDQN